MFDIIKIVQHGKNTLDVIPEIAIYLHHVIQAVEYILPCLLGLDSHLHFMLCWGLESGDPFCLSLCSKTVSYTCDIIQIINIRVVIKTSLCFNFFTIILYSFNKQICSSYLEYLLD